MTESRLSRRRVLAGGAAAAGCLAVPAKVLSQAPAADAVTPALIAAAKKEGRVVWYAAMDLPVSQNVAKRFRGEVSGHLGADRAHRLGAPVPAPGAGIRLEDLRRRHHQCVGRRALRRLEAQRLARALCAGGRREILPGRAPRCRRPVCVVAHLRGLARLQHQHGEAGGRAEGLHGPAASEMDEPAGQGASVLQRHHHDLDLPGRARPRLGLFREARQAEGDAGAVVGRPAEQGRARRARRHGRRQRLQRHPAQGSRAGRSRSSIRPRARR